MNYPELVKQTLFGIIQEMSANATEFSKHPGKDFTRKRKLPFEDLMKFSISMGCGNTNHELLRYFDYDETHPTRSVYVQQRDKLSLHAFSHLLQKFNAAFPSEKHFKGYRIVACDGAQFCIARNPNDELTYHAPSGQSAKGFNMLHSVSLFDVLNKRYLDLLTQPDRKKNEFRALCTLSDRYASNQKTIFVADRGFASYNVFAHLIKNKHHFVIRAKERNVKRMLGVDTLPEALDEMITLILSNTQSKKKHQHPDREAVYRYIGKNVEFDFFEEGTSSEYAITLRLVSLQTGDGTYEYIVTNLPEEVISREDLAYLYRLRWGIETSFRDLKKTIGTTQFHSGKPETVEQEIFARVILYNFCSIIALQVVVKRKQTKYDYQINFSMAIKVCHDFLRNRIDGNKRDIMQLIGKYIEPIKPDRAYERVHRVQAPPSFGYRVS